MKNAGYIQKAYERDKIMKMLFGFNEDEFKEMADLFQDIPDKGSDNLPQSDEPFFIKNSDLSFDGDFRSVRIFDRNLIKQFNSQTRNFGEYSHQRRLELWDKMPEYAYIPNGNLKDLLEKAKEIWKKNIVGLDGILEKILLHMVYYCKTGKTRPLLFVGSPGCGKTTVANTYAKMLGLKSFLVNAPRMGSSNGLYGDSGSYKDASCGAVAEAMIITKTGNPVIIIDEIDKASEIHTRANCNLQNEALNLLDDGADNFRDNFLQVSFDASYCPVVMTANELEDICGPLADRCEIIRFPECTLEHAMNVSKQQIIPSLLKKFGCEEQVIIEYSLVENAVVEMFNSGINSIRAYQSVFENAISSAYLRSILKDQKQNLCRKDINSALNNTVNLSRRRVGFG